ncbi:MAG: DUF3857 domain-containing protein, partial [Sphingobacteriales bacterium]
MTSMKSILSLLMLLMAGLTAFSREESAPSYQVSTIADRLKNNAHAVMRYDHTEMKVLDFDKVLYKKKYAVTILNDKGKKYAVLQQGYTLLNRIDNIKGRLLDSAGKEIRTMKEKDLADFSTYGSSFVYHSDVRVKAYDFNYDKYPYTVEYEVERVLKTTAFLPDWESQPDHDCAIEHSDFTLTYPSAIPVRYKEYLMPVEAERYSGKDDKGNEVRTWKMKDVYAYKEEPFSKTGNHTSATVVLAPGRFELLKYKGSMESWQSLGLFNYKLNEGRDLLPEDKKAMVQTLMADETDTYAKIQKLYAYMQQTTRYVANEYGIAGWQTFDAVNVAQNGYGDCKGLTNYLKALLKE